MNEKILLIVIRKRAIASSHFCSKIDTMSFHPWPLSMKTSDPFPDNNVSRLVCLARMCFIICQYRTSHLSIFIQVVVELIVNVSFSKLMMNVSYTCKAMAAVKKKYLKTMKFNYQINCHAVIKSSSFEHSILIK